MTVVLTGSVPLTSTLADAVTTDASDPKAPYAVPVLTITGLYHAATAFFLYMQYTKTGLAGYVAGLIGYALLATIAMWCSLFASSGGRISRKTGADKRTSGFPFKNAEADKKKGKKRA